jgi:DNA-binding SARP family transcriptional activator
VAHLALSLLGSFQAMLDGQPAQGLSSDWRRALLAYLAVERGRGTASSWPLCCGGRSGEEALGARAALSNLRSALGVEEPASKTDHRAGLTRLAPDPLQCAVQPDSDHWLDVVEFRTEPPIERRTWNGRRRCVRPLSAAVAEDSPPLTNGCC